MKNQYELKAKKIRKFPFSITNTITNWSNENDWNELKVVKHLTGSKWFGIDLPVEWIWKKYKYNSKIDERNTTAPISYNAEIAIMNITATDSTFYWRKSICLFNFSSLNVQYGTMTFAPNENMCVWTVLHVLRMFSFSTGNDDEFHASQLVFHLGNKIFQISHFPVSLQFFTINFNLVCGFVRFQISNRSVNDSSNSSPNVRRCVSSLFLYDCCSTHPLAFTYHQTTF